MQAHPNLRPTLRRGKITFILALACLALGIPAAYAENEVELNDVVLLSVGENKIQAIQAVRQISWMGLAQAKKLVESAPAPVREGVTKMEAAAAIKALEGVKCTAEMRPSKITDARRYAVFLTKFSAANKPQFAALIQNANGWDEARATQALTTLPAMVKEGMTKPEAERLQAVLATSNAEAEIRVAAK